MTKTDEIAFNNALDDLSRQLRDESPDRVLNQMKKAFDDTPRYREYGSTVNPIEILQKCRDLVRSGDMTLLDAGTLRRLFAV